MLKELFLLDPDIIYLNHGSFGACPKPVFAEYQSWQRRLEWQPVEFLGVDLDDYLLQARQNLGRYVNSHENNIVFIPNATHGVNIVARSLKFNPGDEILTSNHEYGACNFIWESVCEKDGSVYKCQSITAPFISDEELINQLWQGVTPKTKLIFISHITSPTSLLMPVQIICQRARQAGILTLIDGAHAPGQIPLDLDTIQPDFYVGNCHKWMLSPKGAGFIYAKPEVQSLIEPLIISWGYQSKYAVPRVSTFVDFLQWRGTNDPAASLSVPAAIEFMKYHHWDDIRKRCHSILCFAIEGISDFTGLKPLYTSDSDLFNQMATIPIPQIKNLPEFKNKLLSEYKIEIPYIDWENHHYLRLSVQGYNTLDDINHLINSLKSLIPTTVA